MKHNVFARAIGLLGIGLAACSSANGDDARDRAVAQINGAVLTIDSVRLTPVRAAARDTAPVSEGFRLELLRTYGDSNAFGRISGLAIVGQHVVVVDAISDPHLASFDKESGRLEWRAGANGDGPFEFRSVSWFYPDDADPSQYWVYDFQHRRQTLVDFDAPARRRFVRERSLNVGVTLESPIVFGNRVISNGLFPNYTLAILDTGGRPISRVASDPPFKNEEMPAVVGRRLLNRTFVAVDIPSKRFVLAYQWAPRLDFFDSTGHRVATARGPRTNVPSFYLKEKRFFWNEDNEMGYTSSAATSRYVYSLFCACKLKDNMLPQLLHVFDWSGRFVREIRLPDQTTIIAVSPNDEVLYAVTPEPYPHVRVYRILDRPRVVARQAGQ